MFNLFQPKKLCQHQWKFIDKKEVIENAGAMVDVYWVNIYQCSKCLKVKREMC